MSELPHTSFLSSAEQAAVENPALKQQAKALTEAEAFAEKLDIDEDGSARIQDYIRTLGKAEARYIRGGLRAVNQMLGAIGITFTEDRPAEVRVEQQTAATSAHELIEIAEVALPPEEPAVITAPAPEPEPTPEVSQATDDAQEEGERDHPLAVETEAVAESAAVESDEPTFDLKAVQRLIGLVNRKAGQEWFSVPTTARDIDTDELAALAVMHAEGSKRPKGRIDSFYGNLADGEVRGGRAVFLTHASDNISKALVSLGAGQASVQQVEAAQEAAVMTLAPVPESKEEVSPDAVAQALHKVIEAEGERGFVLSRVESIFDKLRARGIPTGHITADDVTHRMIEHWAKLYASANGDEETARVNSSVLWGYLVGIDLQDLVEWRAATKPNAKKGDVYNTITAFANGLTRAYNDAFKKGEPINLFPIGEDENDALELEQPVAVAGISADSPRTVEASPKPVPRPVPQKPKAVVVPLVPKALTEVRQPARPDRLEHEPPHVQVAQWYYDRLLERGTNVNLKALEEFLNPRSTSELTENKREAAQAIREWIESVSPTFLHELLEAPRRGRAAVRRLFGVGFTLAGGLPQERDPEPLWKQLRTLEPSSHRPYIEDTFHTLAIVLKALCAQSGDEQVRLES